MCGICGCEREHHPHDHDHGHMVQVQEDIWAVNRQHAAANQDWLQARDITSINLMSSPGSGKTTLLAATKARLGHDVDCAVIVADQQTEADANQLRDAGLRAWQINTGEVCHLDGHRLGHALEDFSPESGSLLFIENIGNLVCPAFFPLGEQAKVVLLSVPEGDNKPLKYPSMFEQADLVIISKIDLLPHCDFSLERAMASIQQIKPGLPMISLSARTGAGMDEWMQWLHEQISLQP